MGKLKQKPEYGGNCINFFKSNYSKSDKPGGVSINNGGWKNRAILLIWSNWAIVIKKKVTNECNIQSLNLMKYTPHVKKFDSILR